MKKNDYEMVLFRYLSWQNKCFFHYAVSINHMVKNN